MVYEIFFSRTIAPCVSICSTRRAPGPFDESRSGFVLGEGGFMLWLEPDDGWRSRGATAHGEILGVGASSAAVPLNAWPDAAGPLVRTMRLALDDAGIEPSDVDVVYASANATQALDRVEGRRPRRPLRIGIVCRDLGERRTWASQAHRRSAACIAALLCGQAGRVPPIAAFRRLKRRPAPTAGPCGC